MSIRKQNFHVQFGTKKALNDFEELQDAVRNMTGVDCTIRIKPGEVNVRTKDYADYLLAKSVLRGRTSKQIIHDLKPLGEKEATTRNPFK